MRGPICRETNPTFVRTPGPLGCSDAFDRNHPIRTLKTPMPLMVGGGDDAKNKSGTQATKAQKQSDVDAVAKLKKPNARKIKLLAAALDRVRKLNKTYETKNKQKDESLRLKKQQVVKDIAGTYKVGLQYVTGMEFSNRSSSGPAVTKGTFIIVYDDILQTPAYVASVILHESSHAQRNAELAARGVNRNEFGLKTEEIWKAIIEIEGYQLELDHASKTGISSKEQKGIITLRDQYLADLATFMGKEAREEVENGGLEKVRERFIQKQKKAQQP